MIFIVVKFSIRPGRADGWMERVADYTAATRAEPGNLFFEWSRSVEDPNEFVLVEAFRDAAAGESHVSADYFATGLQTMAAEITQTPQIINVEVPGEGWGRMAELQPREPS